jgi:DNA-directed RNA polymerase specialized sigma24 family protein
VSSGAAAQAGYLDLSEQRLSDIVAHCQDERIAYRHQHVRESPWSVELLRRAFAGNQEACAAVHATFERSMRAWIGRQRLIDPEDALQEAFCSFFRFAPSQPALVAGDELGPVMSYLQRTTKTALLGLLRKEHRHAQTVYLDDSLDSSDADAADETAEVRLVLRERLQELLRTDEERLIFHWRFVCAMKPQDILERSSDRFADIDAVYAIIQRIVRRLRDDPVIRQLRGKADAA